MDILKAFDVLVRLENKVQALYEYYNKLFLDDREAAGLFYTLALDEKYQSDIVAYQVRMVRRNRALFKDVEIDISAVDNTLANIESIMKAKTPPTFAEALTFTLELKASALEYHYTNLIAKSNPEVAPLISALSSSDKEHTQMLGDLASRRGIDLPPALKARHAAAAAAAASNATAEEKPAPKVEHVEPKPYQLKMMDQLIEVEGLTASLYELFEHLFPAHASIWTTLMREKVDHARALTDLKIGVVTGEAVFEEGKTTTYTINALIEYIKGIRERAERGELDMKKAVSLSLDIIRSVIEKDPFRLFVNLTPELKAKVKKLEIETEEHTGKLKALLGHL